MNFGNIRPMINPIRKKLRKISGKGIFHDSRSDIKEATKGINMIIDKLNEVIREMNKKPQKRKPLKKLSHHD